MDSDAELLAAWAGGNVQAGQALFARYYRSVVKFFANKIDTGAEDLVQQTFIGCVEGRERLRDASSFRSYLFAIAHNVLRNYFRHRRRHGEPVDFEEDSAGDLAPGPSTLIAQHREQRLLLQALRSIPITDQVLLELRYWEHLNGAEIAEIIGIPHPTARGRLRRARERLERALAELCESPAELRSTLDGLERWAAALREQLGPTT